jgi:hypothetical protein
VTAHLHLVDRETGEVLDACPACEVHLDTIAGLNKELNKALALNTKLKRTSEEDARDHPDWPVLGALYDLWRRETGHMKSQYTHSDFWQALPLYTRYGWDLCERAIAGARFDHWKTKRRNGSTKRHDDWTANIFRDRARFEEFCNRAPRGFVARGLPERFTAAPPSKVCEQVGDGAA